MPGEVRPYLASFNNPALPRISAPGAELPVVYFNDIRATLDVADFVEGLFTDRDMSVVYGQSNSGKTFWMMDLALHVAAGKPWQGHEVEQGGVLWLAMEGAHGASNRVTAWRIHHEISAEDLPFAIVPVTLNLLDQDADTEPLIDTIKQVGARFGVPVRWVIVDTLSRAIAGGNENAPDDMGALVGSGTRIQQQAGVALSWIHHSGKDDAKGARGHSLLRAATATEIEITADSDTGRTARVTKQREMDCVGEFSFVLRTIELGVNKRGKPVTSCVVEGCDGGHTADAVLPSRLRGHARRTLDMLNDLLTEGGKIGFPGVPDGCRSIPEEWWRLRFFDRTISDGAPDVKQDSRRAAFRRASAELQEKHLVAVSKGRVWACRAPREGMFSSTD